MDSVLLCDHGERRSGVPAELARLGVDVHAARLPAGDYVVSDRLVVERRGPTDLAASIKERPFPLPEPLDWTGERHRYGYVEIAAIGVAPCEVRLRVAAEIPDR